MTEEEQDRTRTVHNEQTKLRATLLNTVAAGFVVAGIITPIVTVLNSGSGITGGTLLILVVWLLLAFCLHSAATWSLERLR